MMFSVYVINEVRPRVIWSTDEFALACKWIQELNTDINNVICVCKDEKFDEPIISYHNGYIIGYTGAFFEHADFQIAREHSFRAAIVIGDELFNLYVNHGSLRVSHSSVPEICLSLHMFGKSLELFYVDERDLDETEHDILVANMPEFIEKMMKEPEEDDE